jgi:hypothetical protein
MSFNDQKVQELNKKAQEFHKWREDFNRGETLYYQQNPKCSEEEAKEIDNQITKCLLNQPGRSLIWIAIVIQREERKVIERLWCSGKFEREWWRSTWKIKGLLPSREVPKPRLKVNGTLVHDEDELICVIKNALWRRTYQVPERVKYFFKLN